MSVGAQSEMDVTTTEKPGATQAATLEPKAPAKRPWPTGLPDQIKTVAELLASSPQALTLAAIEAHFSARGRWRERLPTILETLEALSRARRLASEPERWQAI